MSRVHQPHGASQVIVERGPFEMVPHWLLEQQNLSAHALRLWLVLRKHGDETKTSFPGRKRLADMLGVSRSTISRAKDELRDAGAMCYRQRSSDDGDWASNEYHLHWVSECECTYFTGGLGSPQVDQGSPRVDDGRPLVDHGSPQVSNELRLRESDLDKETYRTQTAEFDAFWFVYPRKESKGAARKAWTKAVSKASAAHIIAAAERYRDDPNREDGFTAHAATWLNGERWDDDPLPSRAQSSPAMQRHRRNLEFLATLDEEPRQMSDLELAYLADQKAIQS